MHTHTHTYTHTHTHTHKHRYCILTPETYPHWHGSVQDGIRHLMAAVNMEPDQWQLGKSKVFIKSPESVRFCNIMQAPIKVVILSSLVMSSI